MQVRPRWPQRLVRIDPLALDRLALAQASLPPHLQLHITRAYEPQQSGSGKLRTVLRRLGIATFGVLYRARRYGATFAPVESALTAHGFSLHRNQTERLQLHCDLHD